MKTIIIMLMLVFATQSYAADKWSVEDKALASLFTVATVIDWGQTRDIVKNNKDNCAKYGNGCYVYYEETNIYLGKDPSIGEVDTYMSVVILVTLGIAHVLPEKYRSKFLYGMSFIETRAIYNNNKIGLKINF